MIIPIWYSYIRMPMGYDYMITQCALSVEDRLIQPI